MIYKFCLAISLGIVLSVGVQASILSSGFNEVTGYVTWFHARAPARCKKAQKIVPHVVKWSNFYNLDPLLVSTIITFESSWRPDVIGRRGEVGLMQILPQSICSFGQKIETSEDQIRTGARCLRLSLDQCQDLRGGLTMYASGRCTTENISLKRKINLRLTHFHRAVLRHRK